LPRQITLYECEHCFTAYADYEGAVECERICWEQSGRWWRHVLERIGEADRIAE